MKNQYIVITQNVSKWHTYSQVFGLSKWGTLPTVTVTNVSYTEVERQASNLISVVHAKEAGK